MPRLLLYAFRYRCPVTGRWIRARYRATCEEIAHRHTEYQLIEPPEVRDVTDEWASFSPHAGRLPRAS